MKRTSFNGKVAIGFLIAFVLGVRFEAMNPSDGTTSIYFLVLGLCFWVFLVRVLAQEVERQGWPFSIGVGAAVIAMPILVIILFIGRLLGKHKQEPMFGWCGTGDAMLRTQKIIQEQRRLSS